MRYYSRLSVLLLLSACKLNSSGGDSGGQKPAQTQNPGVGPTASGNNAIGVPNGAFLTASVFQAPASITQSPQTELISSINSESDLMQKSPSSSSTSACNQQFRNGTVITANAGSMTITYSQDVTSCMQGSMSAGNTVANMALKLYMYVECPGTDLSSYNGKTLAALPNNSVPCPGASSGVYNSSMTGHLNISSGGTTGAYDVSVQDATMAPDGSKCIVTKTGNALVENNCYKVHRTDFTNVTGGIGSMPSHFALYQLQNVQYLQMNDPYYSSGVIAFRIDNWQGQMMYSGATIAPRWTASSAAGVQASGTFAYQASLALSQAADSFRFGLKYP